MCRATRLQWTNRRAVTVSASLVHHRRGLLHLRRCCNSHLRNACRRFLFLYANHLIARASTPLTILMRTRYLSVLEHCLPSIVVPYPAAQSYQLRSYVQDVPLSPSPDAHAHRPAPTPLASRMPSACGSGGGNRQTEMMHPDRRLVLCSA